MQKSIIFMGTPKFAAGILQTLINNGVDIKLVVTQPDKPFGRKQQLKASEVKEVALKHGIEVFQPVNIKVDNQKILDIEHDVIVTAAYGQIIPEIVLNAPKIIAINIHGSLLPKYRGGAPVHYSVINGDAQTGVTIMEMVKKMDAGEMISQAAFDIDINDTTADVFAKMEDVACDLILKTLPTVFDKTFTLTKQPEDEVTYSPNISKEQEYIDFDDTALNVHNKIRGLVSFPVGHTYINDIRIKLFKSELTKTKAADVATVADIDNDAIYINCRDYVIKLVEIQVAGKKKMAISDYLNGNLDIKKGDKVGMVCE